MKFQASDQQRSRFATPLPLLRVTGQAHFGGPEPASRASRRFDF